MFLIAGHHNALHSILIYQQLSAPALTIEDNENLVDISGLLTIHIASFPPLISISNNPRICHNIAERKQLEAFLRKVNTRVTFVEDCLLSCPGGKVSRNYLEKFDKRCNVVKGNLIISELEDLPTDMHKLEQVEIINGRLIVTNNRAVKDLTFLKNLREINNPELDKPGLVVENNRNFNNKGLSSLIKVTGGNAKAKVTGGNAKATAATTARISNAKETSTILTAKETVTSATAKEILPVIISFEPPEKSIESDGKEKQESAWTDASMPKLRNVKFSRNVENALITIEQTLLKKERMQKLIKQKGPAVCEGLFWLAMFVLVLCLLLAAVGAGSFCDHRKKDLRRH